MLLIFLASFCRFSRSGNFISPERIIIGGIAPPADAKWILPSDDSESERRRIRREKKGPTKFVRKKPVFSSGSDSESDSESESESESGSKASDIIGFEPKKRQPKKEKALRKKKEKGPDLDESSSYECEYDEDDEYISSDEIRKTYTSFDQVVEYAYSRQRAIDAQKNRAESFASEKAETTGNPGTSKASPQKQRRRDQSNIPALLR